MSTPNWLPRTLRIAGPVLMVVGAIDPLEGSIIVALGVGLTALSAHLDHSRHRKLLYWAFALTFVGVASVWILSAFGGFRLPNRPDMVGLAPAFGLLVIPYPVGWIMGLVGAILRIREARRTPAHA